MVLLTDDLLHMQGLIQDLWLGGGDNIIMLSVRRVIVLAILHILIGIGLTNKLQNRRIGLSLLVFSENSINISSD